MANITIFNAVNGEAFSSQVIDGSFTKKDMGWLARLTSAQLSLVGLLDDVQWSLPVPESQTIVIERAVEKSRPRLQIDILPNEKLVATVVGPSSEEVDAERESWWKALRLAIEEMSVPPTKRKWDCMIGPLPVGYRGPYRLKGPIAVGGMRVPPPQQKMFEAVPGFRYGILVNNGHTSWPVMVSGIYSSWQEEGIPDEPMADIQKLCLILSVAMDQPWGPRHNPLGSSDHQLVIPEVADSGKHWKQHIATSEQANDNVTDLDISKWCTRVWKILEDKPKRRLVNAMAMYLEGMILEGNHQSFARIAYVSAVEALREGEVERCETCGQAKGVTQKYRETIESAGVNFVGDVFGPHYGLRSRAVHDAVLDPEDSRWGQHPINSAPDDFWKRNLGLLREKVRSLILDRMEVEDPLLQNKD